MDPEGKVALITGGGVRAGQAISLGLAKAGAHVIVHYNRSAAPAEETPSQARRLGVDATTVQADLTHPEATQMVVQTAIDRFGKVDIMVHAASPFLRASLFDVTLKTWQQIMGVVVESFLTLVQELAPGMMQSGGGGVHPRMS
jgi:3-oxoacyl-[acyl-carrier protein] reductase